MKVTLTGAAGRLGSIVCKQLVSTGHDVLATDRTYRADLPVKLHVANLLDRERVYDVLAGSEAVVHLGNHPGMMGNDAQRIFNENVTMNMNVFEAARQCEVRKIIFASTIQTITSRRPDPAQPSSLPYLPLDGDVPANPGNPYGLSKSVSESMLQYYTKTAPITGIALRFPLLVSAEWLPNLKKDGGQWKQWNYNEAFTYLPMAEAATLIDAVLRAR